MRRVTPVFAAHSMSEWATLLPSPTYAIATPRRSGPLRSRIVKMSARPWHGWERSERPLITGTALYRANSSIVSCAFTRSTTASAIRLATRPPSGQSAEARPALLDEPEKSRRDASGIVADRVLFQPQVARAAPLVDDRRRHGAHALPLDVSHLVGGGLEVREAALGVVR